MNKSAISTRVAFVITLAISLVLLVGSAILSRIVFKAAAVSSSVYFSPTTAEVKVGELTKVDVLAKFTGTASLAGAQLMIKFDPSQLELTDQAAAPGWQVVKSHLSDSSLTLVEVPSFAITRPLVNNQPMELATLTLRPVKLGVVALQLVPTATILASSEGLNQGVDNSLASTQDMSLTVGNTTVTDSHQADQSRVEAVSQQVATNPSGSQAIVGDEPILTANVAVVLVQLQQPARISVRFGVDKSLTNSVSYTSIARQAAVRLNGLDPVRRYYYQVVAASSDGTSRALGQVKSFQLPSLSDQTSVDHASLVVFPATTDVSTTAFAVLYDKQNQVVAGLRPKFATDNNLVLPGSVSGDGGLYQVPLNISTDSKDVVKVSLSLGDRSLASTTFLADPKANVAAPAATLTLPAPDQRTVSLILVLVAALFLLSVGFYKLSRAR